ncbi:MAG: HNH endonuclease [Eubacteriaceae bacterium]|nr:HNH endonuclease [Eubacteriaceae bacterium]
MKIQMVFVLDKNKQPLDMCHPAKARKLLKSGKAAVYRKQPFTIILKKEGENKPKGYRLKIDYGSKHTGLAILKDNEVKWLAVLHHKTTIKKEMEKRRNYRRRRRTANLRYRKPRFNNRKREKGWLPPSLYSRVNNIKTWTKRLKTLCPLIDVSYENVKFDTQKMQNENIQGVEYQQGTLEGYEIREYLLEKFGRKCAYCGKENVPFEVEHIIPKSRGGSNRISNLTIACHQCNEEKGTLTAEEYGHPEVQKLAKKPLKDAAIVTATRWAVYDILVKTGLKIECGTGGRTKYNRIKQELPKEHYYDACCVGASTSENLYFQTDTVLNITAEGRGQHRRTLVTKEGFPRAYLPRQKEFFGFRTGDLVKADVPKGKKFGKYYGIVKCRKSGSFNIKTATGTVQGINHKYFTLVQHMDGYSYSEERRNGNSSHG